MARVYFARGGPSGSPRTFLATTSYSGSPCPDHEFAFLNTIPLLEAAGVQWTRFLVTENCHVDDARNETVREFLKTDCEQLVFLDADVFWRPEDLARLVLIDRDVVAGVYPKRLEGADYPVYVRPGVELYEDDDGLVEVHGVPTGFLKIKRHVLEKLIETDSERQFKTSDDKSGDPKHFIIFERVFEHGIRWGGDYEFCRKWRKLGGKIWVDPYMRLGHLGENQFIGRLADFWLKKHGLFDDYLLSKIAKAAEKLKAGDDSAQNFVDLSEGWGNSMATVQPDLLIAIYHAAKNADGPILECGSGASSVVMALATDQEVHCLENSAAWASRLEIQAQHLGLTNLHIHYAPLVPKENGAKWYDEDKFPDLVWSLVFVDGPWRQKGDRLCVFDAVGHRISGTVIMDDIATFGLEAALRKWAKETGRTVEIMEDATRQFAIAFPPQNRLSAA